MKDNGYRWLIDLRWIAACGVIIATLFADKFFQIQLQQRQLFVVAGLLLLSNIIYSLFYRYFIRQFDEYDERKLRILVLIQIVFDLVLLTFLLHFSGGVENPFIIYYVFHLMIASIILPRAISFGVATLTMSLVGIMAGGEYLGLFKHHPLTGFITFSFYNNLKYLIGTGLIFVSTSYVVVYLTGTVSAKLRNKEHAYRRANMELLEKDKIKNEYVIRITHDIKGHIAAIKNCLDATLIDIPEEKKEEFIRRAYTRTEKLIVFIKDLLRITQLRLRNNMMKERFSLSSLIHEIVDIYREDLNKNNISIQLDLQEEYLYADRLSIAEVFDNLFSNSIKYSKDKGTIRIKAFRNNSNKFNIEFSDTGMGIPREDLSNIFNEFFIASNNRGAGSDNTGMGLAIVKKIIRSHKGSIQVKSIEGDGTTFTIILPNTELRSKEK